jgi:hypothetical protein
MNYPPIPKSSLFTGSMPAFPTTTYSWGFSFFGHWEGFSIGIPNIAGIPLWIAELISYSLKFIMGWTGAFFLYGVEYLDALAYNTTEYVIQTGNTTFQHIIAFSEMAAGGNNIFSPIIASLIMAGLLTGFLLAVMMAIKGIQELV